MNATNRLSFRHAVNRLLSMVLVLLGFSSCESLVDPGEEMYGTPHADFEIKGAVMSDDGVPVSEAEIVMKYPDAVYPIAEPIYTDENGVYGAMYSDWTTGKVRIVCNDPAGVYESDSTDITLKFNGKKSDWYMGKAEAEVNFRLKKEEAE